MKTTLEILTDVLLDRTELWSNGYTTYETLKEALGMTKQQYDNFVSSEDALPFILLSQSVSAKKDWISNYLKDGLGGLGYEVEITFSESYDVGEVGNVEVEFNQSDTFMLKDLGVLSESETYLDYLNQYNPVDGSWNYFIYKGAVTLFPTEEEDLRAFINQIPLKGSKKK